jgi:hypothetical protein
VHPFKILKEKHASVKGVLPQDQNLTQTGQHDKICGRNLTPCANKVRLKAPKADMPGQDKPPLRQPQAKADARARPMPGHPGIKTGNIDPSPFG